ncbi:hypothetical protein [Flavobacterium sp.]|uniref:hypothetical protein n=1 Tax=Flavobacterium sp. TaxID=239 RepID=UPI00122034C9|nr:hypothetical protein [Flavobacterium sp.]RZJ73512.1 MAG: hypothetical protein EOO49_01485 [Flavobacterium sp.]
MKAPATYPDQFKKPSGKTPEQIRQACEQLELVGNSDYIVKHNGKHIWIEVAEQKQEVWSPLLHLEVNEQNDTTYVKGQYVENPVLWATLLVARLVTFAVFFLSAASLAFKWYSERDFDTEILLMAAMTTVWFGLYLISRWNRRLSSKQAAELRDFMDNMVA